MSQIKKPEQFDIVVDEGSFPSTGSMFAVLLKQKSGLGNIENLVRVPLGWISKNEPVDFSSVLGKAAYAAETRSSIVAVGRLAFKADFFY